MVSGDSHNPCASGRHLPRCIPRSHSFDRWSAISGLWDRIHKSITFSHTYKKYLFLWAELAVCEAWFRTNAALGYATGMRIYTELVRKVRGNAYKLYITGKQYSSSRPGRISVFFSVARLNACRFRRSRTATPPWICRPRFILPSTHKSKILYNAHFWIWKMIYLLEMHFTRNLIW